MLIIKRLKLHQIHNQICIIIKLCLMKMRLLNKIKVLHYMIIQLKRNQKNN